MLLPVRPGKNGEHMQKIHHYADQGGGRHNIGVDVSENVTVLVSPRSVAAQPEAERIAAIFVDHQAEMERARLELEECRTSLERAKARAVQAEAALDAAMTGRQRLFGRVLMKPATPGAWDGAVWLLDPEKQEKGMGIRFDSAAEVRQSYPELWVVGMTADGVLLDAAPLRMEPAPVESP
jgi:hypothetical protein